MVGDLEFLGLREIKLHVDDHYHHEELATFGVKLEEKYPILSYGALNAFCHSLPLQGWVLGYSMYQNQS